MAASLYQRATRPQLDPTALAITARKILDLLAYFSRMRRYEFQIYTLLLSLFIRILSSSEPNHLLNKILTKIITFIHMINASALAAQIGYQLATDIMILSVTEEGLQSHANLENMRELSGNGQGIATFVMNGFRDIKQQIYKVRTRNKIFVIIPSSFI